LISLNVAWRKLVSFGAFHTALVSSTPHAHAGLILYTDPPVSDFAQTVKQQADIVKVIEGYIRLRKTGGVNYTGLCPFHK